MNIRRSLASFATTMLVASGLALGISIGSGQVSAALAFYDPPVIDAGGANDVSGQGDLTQFMFGDGTVGWQFDDTARSGNNSSDACALVDTDNDGLANNACASVSGEIRWCCRQSTGTHVTIRMH